MPLTRCQCTSHKCGDKFDDSSGERGVLLDTRTYRRHQNDESKSTRLSHLAALQTQALQEQEESISIALGTLSMQGQALTPQVPPTTPRYRIDHVRKIVKNISAIKDNISTLRVEAASIGAASALDSDQDVQTKLQRLAHIRFSSADLGRKLASTNQGEYRKDPAVKEMREATEIDERKLNSLIDSLEKSWKAILSQRTAQREDELAKGVVEYDTCEWM